MLLLLDGRVEEKRKTTDRLSKYFSNETDGDETARVFTVNTVIRSPSKAGSSAVDVTIGPPDHVRVSTATVTRPSTSAVSACP